MKKLLLFIAIILSGLAVKSQAVLNVFEDWASNAGSQNFFHKSITKTDGSGNVYVAGATVNGSGTYDILVAKYNNSGVQQWIQQYNGYGNYHDFATAVFVDGSGNVYVTGTVTDSLLVQGSDIITMKYNSSGTLQWATRYNGSADYYDAGADIAVDGSGNVYITGSIHTSASYPFTDAIIIKYNSSGTQQWATVYNNTTYNKSEAGARIRLTSGGKAIISGVIQMTTNTYIYGVLEYSMSTGAQIGGAALGTGTSNISYFGDLAIDVNNGNGYIAGAVYDSVTTGYDYYLVKLDSTLAVIWERTYDGGSNLEDMANSVKVDGAGSVYVTGYTTNATQRKNITTRKYNSSGGLVWTQTYNDTLNGDDAAMSMAIDADANIYITGYDSTALGKTSYITIKYDSAGAEQWKIRYDGMAHQTDKATNICIDDNGDIIVTGLSETAPATYEYITIKYIEENIITPTDALGESASSNFLYYKNKGQLISTDSTFIPDVKYYTNNTYPSYYFKNDTMSMVFARIDTVLATDDTLHRIDMAIEYSNVNAKIYSMKEQEAYLNYFLGHCPEGVTGIHGNQQLVIPDILYKIDLIYTSNQNGIKYYFIVKPGADPTKIGMIFTGATSTQLDTATQYLTISSDIGSMAFDQPFVYQIDSSNDTINGSSAYIDWSPQGGDKYYFTSFPSYNTGEILIIEVDQGNGSMAAPAIDNLKWSTYYGGQNDDGFDNVRADNIGNVYVCGNTKSFNFPQSTIIQPSLSALTDAVIVKFNNNLIREWATFYGGNGHDYAVDLGLGSTGNVYFIGKTTSSNFPTPVVPIAGALNDPSYAGATDGFVVKLDQSGQVRLWASYLGGNGTENLFRMKFDLSGNYYIVGEGTSSSPLKMKNNAYYSNIGGGYIVKFNSQDTIVWASLIAGTRSIFDVSTYGSQNQTVICGTANNSNFPFATSSVNSYIDSTLNGTTDGFISKFNQNDTITWSTYIGGNSQDMVLGLSISSGLEGMPPYIYMTGQTFSSDFPFFYSSGQYIDTILGGGSDGFYAKFNLDGEIVWSTLYGGSNHDFGWKVVTDLNNKAYFIGQTYSTDLNVIPLTNAYTQNNTGSNIQEDAFLFSIDSDCSALWTTYFSGYGFDQAVGIEVFQNSNLYLTGLSYVPNGFPLVDYGNGSWYKDTLNGNNSASNSDGYIAKFDLNSLFIGISEISFNQDNLLVFPNPSDGNFVLQIEISKKSDIEIEIFTVFGQTVYRKILKNQIGFIKENIDILSLSNGLYFVSIYAKDKKYVSKIIKQ